LPVSFNDIRKEYVERKIKEGVSWYYRNPDTSTQINWLTTLDSHLLNLTPYA
jgi:hypothetical protein